MEIVSEKDYQRVMDGEVVPFLEKYRYCGYFSSDAGGKIYYERYRREHAKGVVVMVHGFSESAEKYAEMAYYFLQAGFQVYVQDVRGHGRSVRIEEDLSLIHVDRYESYLSDLKCLAGGIAKNENPSLPLYLYGHSMGGGIGAALLEKTPDLFQKAVLSSPMLKPLTGNVPFGVARMIAGMQVRLGSGRKYVAGQHAFLADETFENSASTSRERYAYYYRKRLGEKLFQNSGASYSWLREAARLSEYVLKPANCRKIRAEVLLFQAGREDYVDKKAQEQFARRVESARLISVTEAKHEIYMGSDAVVETYVKQILNFFR